MFGWPKKKPAKLSESEVLQRGGNFRFQWHEIGEGNPFNKRILDIRSFTLSMIATTSKKEVAEKFTSLRTSVGNEHIGTNVSNSKSTSTNLTYPHNGASLQGVVFKADSMDCKWDIYIYDGTFYFSRSWTGDLVYKATANVGADLIQLLNIEYPSDMDELLAINNVHFLIMSHAFGKVFPHMIPKGLESENDIAAYSFSAFGNKACYASHEQITDTVVNIK